MNPFAFVMRRPMTAVLLVVAVVAGGVFGLKKMRAETYPQGTPKVYVYLDYVEARARQTKDYVSGHFESYFKGKHQEEHQEEGGHKIVATSPKVEDVVITQQYVCQIHAQKHINVCALEGGYLQTIHVNEGQAVKKDDLMFKIVPTLYKAKMEAEKAKMELAQVKYESTKKLSATNPSGVAAVSQTQLMMYKAELTEANANYNLAQAELDFASIKAPFDGIIDRLREREGSLIKDEGILTTLSDNSVMWVYFNVPEARYLEYQVSSQAEKDAEKIELVLANGNKFAQNGRIGAVEAQFNNETGNIPFRADFPNPTGLLRHGQTGTILIHRDVKNATVIPQRATFENLAKRYIYVVGEDKVVHQREILIQNELDDLFVIKEGVNDKEKIVFEGVRQVHDGEKVEFEFKPLEELLAHLKNKAE